MKYEDYPLPCEELVKLLNAEYIKCCKTKTHEVCTLSILEEQNKLSELLENIQLQEDCLKHIKKFNKKLDSSISVAAHLQILKELGAQCLTAHKQTGSRSCHNDFLRCQSDIFKMLVFLIFLDNLNCCKAKLIQILTEQTQIFYAVINS